jgi:COP9 signalosome complex subunit 6
VKDVHKVPALDLVGWYTILPTSGPQPAHLPVHRQILDEFNESAILLGFHPSAVVDGPVGGKLPITIYESNYEAEEITPDGGEDKEMTDGEPLLGLRFKELPYTIETGEAEMIGIDFVARGGGNATAVDGTVNVEKPASSPEGLKGKGKTRAAKKSDDQEVGATKSEDQHILSREDEELIASLTTKANAIKMLRSRIDLISVYLRNLPPSYISSSVPEGVEPDDQKYTPVNHSVLRSIQALLTRLSLLIPADSAAFEQELLSEQNDVNLVSLLSTITNSIKDVREIGKKSAVIEAAKSSKNKGSQGIWDGQSGVSGVGDLLS